MISTTETTAPTDEEATETDQEWQARRRRERHQRLLDNLEYLADVVADAGPLSQISGDAVDIQVNVGLFDGSMTEQIDRLHAVAATLGASVEERPSKDGLAVHYAVNVEPAEGIKLHVFAVAGCMGLRSEEIPEAAAAHKAHLAERVTVSYEVAHDEPTTAEVTAALARLGIDAVCDIGHLDHGHVTVQPLDLDEVFVDNGEAGGALPDLGRCTSVDAYAAAVAAYARGDFDGAPCPAIPTAAWRAIHADGTVLTSYAARCCADDTVDALHTDGYYVIALDSTVTIPAGANCGHRAESLGGTR